MAEELQQADTAANQAEANAENRPAGGSRTYTEAEVDARIKSRIDKQNARHAEELEGIRAKLAELEERSAKAEAERDALTKAAEIEKLKQDAAAENGIPAHLIRGNTAEEIAEHAAALKAAIPTVPSFRDSGAPKSASSGSKQAFAEFMQSNFSS